MTSQFGTSGLRGLVTDLLGGDAMRHARAFARHLKTSGAGAGQVMLGRDFRDSSPEIARISAMALAAEGFLVLDCGAIPTPALASFAMASEAPALMVTGSHIPADRNGLKFYRPEGEITKPDEIAIAALAAAIDPTEPLPAIAPENAEAPARRHLLDRYRGLFPENTLKGARIGVYAHSAVAIDALAEQLSLLGAEPVVLGQSPVFVPLDTEAVEPEVQALLRRWAAEERLDALVSTDADGDRPLVADEQGAVLRGDLLGLLAARRLGARLIVTPVTSNSGLEAGFPGTVRRTRVGSPYVIAGMQAPEAEGPVVGFEANGGLLLGTPVTLNGKPLAALPTRDSFLPILCVLAIAREEGLPLSALASKTALPICRSDRLKDVATARSAALLARLAEDGDFRADFLTGLGVERAHDLTDGLRLFLDDGEIVHLRASGNAPELRCYVEAPAPDRADQLLDDALARLTRFLS